MNLKVILAYDGSAYAGWQRQASGISVQQRLEEALQQISGRRVIVKGASRTDSGVHALGMAADFEWPVTRPDFKQLPCALNSLLPEDIRILKIMRASPGFHARFDARWKLYRYRILNTPVSDPFRRATSWFIHKPLILSRMRSAARCFVGKKDFSSVAANPGYERSTMIRHIRRCAVLRRKDEVHIEVEADGFLYKMVRTITGMLVEVGLGKRAPESVRELLKARDRKLAGKTAPPQGLFLVRIYY